MGHLSELKLRRRDNLDIYMIFLALTIVLILMFSSLIFCRLDYCFEEDRGIVIDKMDGYNSTIIIESGEEVVEFDKLGITDYLIEILNDDGECYWFFCTQEHLDLVNVGDYIVIRDCKDVEIEVLVEG
jgi:hypothetical protein